MDKQEIIEGNIIIAEFMGKKFKPYKGNASYDIEFDKYSECQEWIEDSHLEKEYEPELGWNVGVGKYDSSWNWLMPVVQKIKATSMLKGRAIKQTNLWEEIIEGLMSVDLNKIWKAVVNFLKWYNSQKQ